MNTSHFKYEKIDGYDPIILRFYLNESMKALNLPSSCVSEWINNGFEISGRELFIEVREVSRKRLKGHNHEVVVFCKIYVENSDGSGHIEDEIRGRFSLGAYDKIAECVITTLFKINMESILQNCIRIIDYMGYEGRLPVQTIEDIDDFIEADTLKREEEANSIDDMSIYDV